MEHTFTPVQHILLVKGKINQLIHAECRISPLSADIEQILMLVFKTVKVRIQSHLLKIKQQL